MVDDGTAAIITAALAFAGVVYSVRYANKKGTQQAESGRQAQEQVRQHVAETLPFADNLALTQYVRQEIRDGTADAVADATKDLREELDDVKQIVMSLHGRLRRIRQAVREWVAIVRATWGKTPEPPELHRHIAELIDEDDPDDTLTMERIRRIAESTARSDQNSR